MLAPPKRPFHDELEALIKEARARQLRRRLLGAAAVAIGAAVGLCLYALMINGNVKDTAAAKAGSPSIRLCRSAQLSASGGLNGGSGLMLGPVTLTNSSSSACSLPAGRPNVQIVWRGRVLDVRETGGGSIDSRATPVRLLEPHSTAMLYMAWGNWCGRPSEGTIIRPTFELRWADGLAVNAPDSNLTPPRCNSRTGGSVLAVGVPVRD
jgi:hypothetical protein